MDNVRSYFIWVVIAMAFMQVRRILEPPARGTYDLPAMGFEPLPYPQFLGRRLGDPFTHNFRSRCQSVLAGSAAVGLVRMSYCTAERPVPYLQRASTRS